MRQHSKSKINKFSRKSSARRYCPKTKTVSVIPRARFSAQALKNVGLEVDFEN